MATEVVKTGKIYRILSDEVNKIWDKISFWNKASDTEFNDGKNAETKLGAINGITDSLNSTSSNIAASAKALNQLNGNLGGLSFYEDEDGNKYVVGADSVPKKLGSCDFEITVIATYDNSISDGLYQKKFTYKNGLWTNTDISKDNGSGAAKGWLNINVNDFKLL